MIIFIIIAICIVIAAVCLSACMLSSQISRLEEEKYEKIRETESSEM